MTINALKEHMKAIILLIGIYEEQDYLPCLKNI